MNHNLDNLKLLGDIDDQYVLAASKKWNKKQSRITRFAAIAVACASLVLILSCSTLYQKEVKAGIAYVTSLIGRVLGFEKDITSFTEQLHQSITKDGITITIEEAALNNRKLWIAYTEERNRNMDKTGATGIRVWLNKKQLVMLEGKAIPSGTEGQVSRLSCTDCFLINDEIQECNKLKIQIFPIDSDVEADTVFEFDLSLYRSELETETVSVTVSKNIEVYGGKTLNIKEFRWNPFEAGFYCEIDDLDSLRNEKYWIRGKDDKGNEVRFRGNNYSKPDLHFILDSGWISKDAETLTLQVYGYIDQEEDTGKITGETDGEIISESYHEYLEEAPEDMAEPMEDIFEISILG